MNNVVLESNGVKIPVTEFKNGDLIVSGIKYTQVPYDEPYKAEDPCGWCTAFRNLRLCDILARYCDDQFVFIVKIEKEKK